MLVVADSSPLRYLVVLEQQELLPAIFGTVCTPSLVIAELTTPSAPVAVRDFVGAAPDWLTIKDPGPAALETVSSDIDPGERAALALASELSADLVLLDDAAGRREAVRLNLRMTGTVGILRLAAERALIDVPAVVERLRASGFYLSETLIQSAFGEWL